jgi:hypothetical protein
MKNKASILFYLLLCSLIIVGAVYGGKKQHTHCPECTLAMELNR